MTASEECLRKTAMRSGLFVRLLVVPWVGGTQFSLEDINGALISWESSSEAECCVPELSAGAESTPLHMRD